MKYHMPSLVNAIALSLGHAMSITPEQAAACTTLADWHAAASERLQQYLEEQEAKQIRLPGPFAYWRLDGNTINYTTMGRRVAITADNSQLDLTVYAGPNPNETVYLGTLMQESDGRYQLHEVPSAVVPRVIRLFVGPDNDDEYGWGQIIAEGTGRKPGRPIIYINVKSSGDIYIEWASSGRKLATEKPERLSDLFYLNKRVFGGEIVDRDEELQHIEAELLERRKAHANN